MPFWRRSSQRATYCLERPFGLSSLNSHSLASPSLRRLYSGGGGRLRVHAFPSPVFAWYYSVRLRLGVAAPFSFPSSGSRGECLRVSPHGACFHRAPKQSSKSPLPRTYSHQQLNTPPRRERHSSSPGRRQPSRWSPKIRRAQSTAGSGTGLEITFWDSGKQVTVQFRLRRFEIVCVLIVILALLVSVTNSDIRAGDILRLATLFFRP